VAVGPPREAAGLPRAIDLAEVDTPDPVAVPLVAEAEPPVAVAVPVEPGTPVAEAGAASVEPVEPGTPVAAGEPGRGSGPELAVPGYTLVGAELGEPSRQRWASANLTA
jgi:hypothetical protein